MPFIFTTIYANRCNCCIKICSPIKTIGEQKHNIWTSINRNWNTLYLFMLIRTIQIDFSVVLWYTLRVIGPPIVLIGGFFNLRVCLIYSSYPVYVP